MLDVFLLALDDFRLGPLGNVELDHFFFVWQFPISHWDKRLVDSFLSLEISVFLFFPYIILDWSHLIYVKLRFCLLQFSVFLSLAFHSLFSNFQFRKYVNLHLFFFLTFSCFPFVQKIENFTN